MRFPRAAWTVTSSAWKKMRDAGVMPCAAEQAVYELLEHAEAAEFKQILSLVKQSV